MRVVLGGEKATVPMQDIRRIRIFIVITPLMFFEMFVWNVKDREGPCQKLVKCKSQKIVP